jgi:hypothetical protein
MQTEIWKDIPGYEGMYQVSNFGNVKSLNYGKEKILKCNLSDNYLKVTLSKNNKLKNFRVHQLVAVEFLNHIQNGHKIVVDHIDSNTLNNNVNNLRLITQRENCSKEKTIKKGLPVGVHYHKRDKKYESHITINGKLKYLGRFKTIEEASNVYQNKLKEISITKNN